MRPRRAVILLSGGLDSATVLAGAKAEGLECHALTVLYGQRHAYEVECARRLASALGAAEHRLLEVDLRSFGGSSLVGEGPVPKGRPEPSKGTPETTGEASPSGPGRSAEAIPSTYVPARNTVLLSLALAWAEVLGAEAVYLGVNAVDYSGYPDCRPEFIAAFRELARVANRVGVEGRPIDIRAPLISMSKGEIVTEGRRLGVDFLLTSSCYDPLPGGRPCGECESCKLRARGFREAGLIDPAWREDREAG